MRIEIQKENWKNKCDWAMEIVLPQKVKSMSSPASKVVFTDTLQLWMQMCN